jgi:hypothetical protein
LGTPFPDSPLHSIAMLSPDDGWAVGGQYYPAVTSVIAHWDGSTWSAVPSPVNEPLHKVVMNTAQDGWATASEGGLLHWDGANWTPVDSPAGSPLYGLALDPGSASGWSLAAARASA